MPSTLPSEHVDKAALVTVGIGDSHCVDNTMPKRRKVLAYRDIEALIKL
jgi:hypothetical protein